MRTFISAIALLSLSACGSADKGDKAPARTEEIAAPAAAHAIGQAVQAGSFEFTLKSIEERPKPSDSPYAQAAGDGQGFVVAKYAIKNLGTKPVAPSDLPKVELVDAGGTAYSEDIVASAFTSEESGIDNLRLLTATAKSRNKQLKHIVGLLLLTGARKSELLQAQWQHVDLERRAWLISTSKSGKARHVPLSQAAIDIIEKLPRFKDCPWLLPNLKTKAPFTDIKNPWISACKAAGLGNLHLHDLRHSAASFMINAGIDLFAVGKVLGHADHQSTMRYAHLANDTLLAAVEAGAAKMQL